MARRAIVTRTVVGVEVEVLAVNIVEGTTANATYTMSGTWKDSAKLLKDVKKAYDTAEVTIVAIKSQKPVNKIYGMWEEDFIANAMELDDNRKPLDQPNAEDEASEG